MDSNTDEVRILDSIFTVMERLYTEMRQNNADGEGHNNVFADFAELGRVLVNADRASFWRWDKVEHKLVTTAATGVKLIEINEGEGLVGQALAENCPVITNDPYNNARFNAKVDKDTGYVTKSVMVLPVSDCRGEVIGAFQVINKLGAAVGFDENEDVKRLSIAAFICGIALESDLFLDAAQKDKLTGLKNRQCFFGDMQTKYRYLLQEDNTETLSLIMCDIDHFKVFNDTYGHNAGDAVLRHVAKVMRGNVREKDSIYRWGGEEFLLLFAGADIENVRRVAERIRLSIEESVCRYGERELKVTMSFGCAEYDSHLTPDENINAADKRLYRAKESGRNRVVAE